MFDASPGKYLLSVAGTARYLVSDGKEIIVDPLPSADPDAVRLFLLGSCVGALLHQRHALPLHASSITTPTGAVVFAGPSGGGKSTLAAAFSRRGFPILADDVSVIDASGAPQVMPGTISLKLWCDALLALGLPDGNLRRVRAGLKKYFLPIPDGMSAKAVRLHSIYILQIANVARATVSPVSGLAKIRAFTANTFRKNFIDPMGLAESYFEQVGRVAALARMKCVVRPRDGFRIDDLVDLLIDDFDK